ncbi:MAG: M14 family metallopeptidase [Candidatus Aminicenantia bacterium]
MKNMLKIFVLLLILSFPIFSSVPSPKEILGFQPGEDFKLASWEEILKYFNSLDRSSEKVKLLELGKSTLGRRFVMVLISSEENLKNIEEIKRIHYKLHDPRITTPEEASELAKKGKAIIAFTCAIHSTEIASTLFSMRLAYWLASSESEEVRNILKNIILILVPSLNPDGIDMVVEWYRKYLNTPYEASQMPWLYHYYAGHDNNRDWFMCALKETNIMTKVYYHEWFPLLIWDIHQMGQNGPRLFIPPYYDPINPTIDPLLWKELNLLCSEASLELTKADKKGVATNAIYDGWYNSANRSAPLRHNVIGILSEAASANLASPVFLRPQNLSGRGRGIYDMSTPQSSYLEPWEGGWWRIGDIVDYEEIVAKTFLRRISKDKERFILNFYNFAKRQIEKGKNEPPYAFIIPIEQRDLPTTMKLIEVVQKGGGEVWRTKKPFSCDGVNFPEGTFVILLSQPYRAFIKDLLEVKVYPARKIGETLEYPYDEATWTLPLQMGVRVIEAKKPFNVEMEMLPMGYKIKGRIKGKSGNYLVLAGGSNNEITLLMRSIKNHFRVFYLKENLSSFKKGAIAIEGKYKNVLSKWVEELGITAFWANLDLGKLSPIKIGVGIYKPYIPNMDEGWTRLVFENFEIPYKSLSNSNIKSGDFNELKSILFPPMSAKAIIDGRSPQDVPPEYAGGIGMEGVRNLKGFIRNGGTLITMGTSAELPINYFGIKVTNVLKEEREKPLDKREFFSPGSILLTEAKEGLLSFGLPSEISIFYNEEPVFDWKEGEAILKFPEFNPLMSGIIKGENLIKGKSPLLEITYGKGKIVIFGFDVIHRAQAHGTFRLLFNAIIY